MKKTYIKVKRLEENKYYWESQTQSKRIINQTELLLLLGGTIAASLLNGVKVNEEVEINMSKKQVSKGRLL